MPRDEQPSDTPEIPHGIWEGHEKLDQQLSRPHGFQQLLADRRPLDIDYLPTHPADHGTYVYLALVYPLIDLKVSLWEYYHSQSDIDLRPKTYITDEAPAELFGTQFHLGKEAHRLHWQPDEAATKLFIEFIRTVVFKQESRKRVWALAVHPVVIPYPKTGSVDRITMQVVLPYAPAGAFMPTVKQYDLGGARRAKVVWADQDVVGEFTRWRQAQNQRRFEQHKQEKAYAGLPPVDDDAHPYYKAEELAAMVQTLWGLR